jgi:glycosyltransferase involved in cell wall biosynthesis
VKIVDIINLSSSAETLLKRRVSMMRASGADNRIICIDGPYVRSLREAGIPVHTVRLPQRYHLLKLVLAFFQIAAYLRRERVDLVHTHCTTPGFVGRFAARAANVPVIMHTAHGFYFDERSRRAKRLFFALLERLAGLFTDALLTQNRADLETARKYRIVPAERSHLIGNGIDLARFQIRPPLPPPDGQPTITCIARLEPVKNHPLLFEAVRRLWERGERFKVWLVGGGSLREEYQSLCGRMDYGHLIHFLGYRNDVPQLLAQTDILVLTSIMEGIPRAVLEAMAVGLPVVATRVTGTAEVVQHGQTGYLVELGDAEDLAARLGELLRRPQLRAEMGARGRQVALREFDETPVVESLKQIYRTLLLKKGLPASVPRLEVVEP